MRIGIVGAGIHRIRSGLPAGADGSSGRALVALRRANKGTRQQASRWLRRARSLEPSIQRSRRVRPNWWKARRYLWSALPGYGHKVAFDAIASYRAPTRRSSSARMPHSARFTCRANWRSAASRATIIAWGTTVVTGRQKGPAEVNVSTVRKKVDIATVPHPRGAEGLALCKALFGDRFVDRAA